MPLPLLPSTDGGASRGKQRTRPRITVETLTVDVNTGRGHRSSPSLSSLSPMFLSSMDMPSIATSASSNASASVTVSDGHGNTITTGSHSASTAHSQFVSQCNSPRSATHYRSMSHTQSRSGVIVQTISPRSNQRYHSQIPSPSLTPGIDSPDILLPRSATHKIVIQRTVTEEIIEDVEERFDAIIERAHAALRESETVINHSMVPQLTTSELVTEAKSLVAPQLMAQDNETQHSVIISPRPLRSVAPARPLLSITGADADSEDESTSLVAPQLLSSEYGSELVSPQLMATASTVMVANAKTVQRASPARRLMSIASCDEVSDSALVSSQPMAAESSALVKSSSCRVAPRVSPRPFLAITDESPTAGTAREPPAAESTGLMSVSSKSSRTIARTRPLLTDDSDISDAVVSPQLMAAESSTMMAVANNRSPKSSTTLRPLILADISSDYAVVAAPLTATDTNNDLIVIPQSIRAAPKARPQLTITTEQSLSVNSLVAPQLLPAETQSALVAPQLAANKLLRPADRPLGHSPMSAARMTMAMLTITTPSPVDSGSEADTPSPMPQESRNKRAIVAQQLMAARPAAKHDTAVMTREQSKQNTQRDAQPRPLLALTDENPHLALTSSSPSARALTTTSTTVTTKSKLAAPLMLASSAADTNAIAIARVSSELSELRQSYQASQSQISTLQSDKSALAHITNNNHANQSKNGVIHSLQQQIAGLNEVLNEVRQQKVKQQQQLLESVSAAASSVASAASSMPSTPRSSRSSNSRRSSKPSSEGRNKSKSKSSSFASTVPRSSSRHSPALSTFSVSTAACSSVNIQSTVSECGSCCHNATSDNGEDPFLVTFETIQMKEPRYVKPIVFHRTAPYVSQQPHRNALSIEIIHQRRSR